MRRWKSYVGSFKPLFESDDPEQPEAAMTCQKCKKEATDNFSTAIFIDHKRQHFRPNCVREIVEEHYRISYAEEA